MENSRRHPQLDFFGEEREMCDREEVRKGRGDPMMLKNCRGMVPNTIKILLLSAKHKILHSNSLIHKNWDGIILLTSPLIRFLLLRVAIQPQLQA